jgi:hypothetical protein
MLGSSLWMPCAPQGVKETDDDDEAGPGLRGRPAGQLHGSPACKWCKDIAGIIGNVVLVTPHVKEFLQKLSAIWARAVIKGLPALS